MDDYDSRWKVKFFVEGEPVPWSSPERMRWGGSKPNPRLTGWQGKIAEAAREAFGPRLPWTEGIVLRCNFGLSRNMPKSAEFGDPACPEIYWDEAQNMHRMHGKASDLTNLIKSAEDALESIVFVNDAQVASHSSSSRVWSETPGVEIQVCRMLPWTAKKAECD